MSYKDIRMEMVEKDIRDSVPYESDYKEIKKRYEEARTDEEWRDAIDEHDRLLDEELEYTRKILAAFKRKEYLQ